MTSEKCTGHKVEILNSDQDPKLRARTRMIQEMRIFKGIYSRCREIWVLGSVSCDQE